MPKLRVPPSEKENREITAKIKYGMEIQQITQEQLALAAHMTRKTLYSRYKKPNEFKLSELRLISKKLQIPLTEILKGE